MDDMNKTLEQASVCQNNGIENEIQRRQGESDTQVTPRRRRRLSKPIPEIQKEQEDALKKIIDDMLKDTQKELEESGIINAEHTQKRIEESVSSIFERTNNIDKYAHEVASKIRNEYKYNDIEIKQFFTHLSAYLGVKYAKMLEQQGKGKRRIEIDIDKLKGLKSLGFSNRKIAKIMDVSEGKIRSELKKI